MNRQQRRNIERKVEKDMSVLKNMSEKNLMKVHEIIEKTIQSRTDQLLTAIDRNLTALLIEEDYNLEEVFKLQNKLADLLQEDSIKFEKIEGENGKMKELEINVKDFMKDLMKAGKNKKDIISETAFNFNKLSKTMIINSYAKVKEEYMKESLNYKPVIKKSNKDTEKIKEIPFSEEITEEQKELIKEEVEKNLVEDLEKEEVIKGLKIVEEEVVRTLKLNGINGDYTAKTGIGVVVENEGYKLGFSNIEELEVFYREVREVFTLI